MPGESHNHTENPWAACAHPTELVWAIDASAAVCRSGFVCASIAQAPHPSAPSATGPWSPTPESNDMNPIRLLAIALIIAGTLGLIYGGFSYTKDTTVVKLGPIEVSAKEKQTVNIPLWAGVGAIAVGGFLFVFGGKKR